MKKILLTGILALIAILLLIIAVKEPIQTTPTQPIITQPETPTPRLEIPKVEEMPPTPKAEEPLPPGVPIQKVQPRDIQFWVNNIQVAPTTDYYGGAFIRLEDDDIKTFAGSFGPYFEDPLPYLYVELCSELYKVGGAPSCEPVPLLYKGGYVSFARGYKFDEYIGGNAAKDYIAYYTVYSGPTEIAHSNVGVIRTVKG